MNIVATYNSPVLANRAVVYLRAHGIAADVGMPAALPHLQITVFVLDDSQSEAATQLLAGIGADSGVSEAEWEAATVPDLSKLTPDKAPNCPACGAVLPLNARLERCPSCNKPVDVPELIAQTHGPEALGACFDDPELSDESGDGSAVGFPCECGFSLLGLPWQGRCPECGRFFDKRAHLDGVPVLKTARCPCGYALTGLAMTGRCPECGRKYIVHHRVSDA